MQIPSEPSDGFLTRYEPRCALVTGGAGFIGGRLSGLLLDRGFKVRVLDLKSSPSLDSRADFIEGCILDGPLLREAMADVDWVFHLAADPNLWAIDRESFFSTNTEGTRRVVEAAGRSGASRIVYTSTESILIGRGRSDDALIDENVLPSLEEMRGSYCRSKFLAEREALAAAERGLPVIVVNPTMPIGAGDYRLTPPTRMLIDFLNGENPAYLEFEMNLVHVVDAARGHILAAERGRVGERYILGGTNIKLSEVLSILEELTGLGMPKVTIPYPLALAIACASELYADWISHKPPRASLTGVQLAGVGMRIGSAKATTELGYSTSPLREALAEAVVWLAQQGLVRRPLPSRDLTLQDA